jgi:hypothetical protein
MQGAEIFHLLSMCALLEKYYSQGYQIFLGTAYKNGKNIPNNHKIYQMALK